MQIKTQEPVGEAEEFKAAPPDPAASAREPRTMKSSMSRFCANRRNPPRAVAERWATILGSKTG
jgi:hypothetical protein